jgi:HAE1 family hydrophobic/amphiphilic exporter-1
MALPIASSNGTLYPLSALANVQSGTGPTRLSRQNQQAIITVGANLEGRSQGDVATDIQKSLANVQLPVGVTWKFSGQMAQAQSAYSSLIFALLLGLIFVYMVLASQFGSFIHPLTVMAALPLAIIGSVAAMVVTHTQLSVISMIGIILMMGLATKNSILLVDFIIRYRKEGLDRTQAILEAGPVRLRPIFMTSLAIILGMVPTAVAVGASGSFRAPMAIAVIGGTISSTLLSLVAVPVIYTLIDDVTVGFSRLFRRKPVVEVTPGSATLTDVEEEPKNSMRAESKPDVRQRKWWRR